MTTNSIPHTCPDCLKPFHVEYYKTWTGATRITYTCRTHGCPLNSVTLTAEEWDSANLNDYRKVNAAKGCA